MRVRRVHRGEATMESSFSLKIVAVVISAMAWRVHGHLLDDATMTQLPAATDDPFFLEAVDPQ